MTAIKLNNSDRISVSDEKSDSDENKQMLDLFGEDVFIPIEEGNKNSFEKGWRKKRNLISQEEAEKHLKEGGNIGVVTGKWFNGVTYVLFDEEEEGILPEEVQSIIDSHALISFDSAHIGKNRIVKIESRESYNLLDNYPETVYNLREGDDEDFEIISNKGSPLPPSEFNHKDCDPDKPCDGKGKSRYELQSINPDAPAMDIETVRRLGELLDIEAEEESEDEERYSDDEDIEAPAVDPRINPEKEFADNVPSVKHDFDDRMNYMMEGDWDGQEEFIRLWNGDFSSIPGSDKQGKGECRLATKLGFFMGKNQKMIQFFMSSVPFDSNYEKYPSHREFLLDKATSVDWVFCEGNTFKTKVSVAEYICTFDKVKTSEIVEMTEYKKRMVQYVVNVLEAEGVVEREQKERRDNIIHNIGITEGYLHRLRNINERYNSNDEKHPTVDSNVERITI